MFCSNCGTQLPENSVFCPNCGMRLTQTEDGMDYANSSMNWQQTAAPYGYDQQADGQNEYYQDNAQADKYRGYPMKWHKFLVYFSLWFSAFLNGLTGLASLSGAQYKMVNVEGKTVYSLLPSLEPIDKFYGVFLLILAFFTILTAICLIKLKRGAPRWLIALYTVSLLGGVVYGGLVDNVLRSHGSLGAVVSRSSSSMIISVVMITVNYIYYKKREELFVN